MRQNAPRKSQALLLLALATVHPVFSSNFPSGVVVGWGDNVLGESTGVASAGRSTGSVTIAGVGITNAIAVAAGMKHGLALRDDGIVVGWGFNGRGQAAGSPTRPSGVVAIDGQVLSNVVALAAGGIHSHALGSQGNVAAWGTQLDGTEIRVPAGLSNVVSIAGWYPAAAKSDGTVIDWTRDRMRKIEGLSNVVAVSAPRGYGPIVCLRKDGTVVTATVRGASPPSLANITSNVTAIAAGRWQNLALKADGTVFAWGSNTSVPSGLTNVVAVAAGDSHSLALKGDGVVIAWGRIGLEPASVPAGLSNVVAIAAGNDFSLAITTNPAVAARFMPKRE